MRYKRYCKRILIERSNGFCEICNRETNSIHNDPLSATIDHRTPLSKGGSNELCNLQLACLKCNVKKSNELKEFEGIKM